MPDYPAGNDREYDLVKKIAENTAEIAAGGGGGGAVSSVNGDTGAVVVDAANLPASLNITYTGTPQGVFVISLRLGLVVILPESASGAQTYAGVSGPAVESFAYGESATPVSGRQLLTLSFNDLAAVAGSFSLNTMSAITSLVANSLVVVGGTFNPGTMALLTTLQANALANVGGTFSPNIMAALTSLSFPALVNVFGGFSPNTMASLTTFSFPELKTIGNTFSPNTMASLTTVSLPKLERVAGNLSLATMAALTTVSFPLMISYGGTITMSSGLGALSAATLGTIGTLKSIGGATINLSGQALPSSEVNAILALLVSLDGTNGTTLWGSGKTLTINGGTNGAPTGQGITDKATLIGRGATVTTT